MAGNKLPRLNLVWNQEEHYWICITPFVDGVMGSVESVLEGLNLSITRLGDAIAVKVPQLWGKTWESIINAAGGTDVWDKVSFSIVPGGDAPTLQLIELNQKSKADIQSLVSSLWLGRALLEGRIVCHLQPVMDRRGKVFGYESFARIVEKDGAVIDGGKIFAASEDMQIEYMVDRYLQVQSIHNFIETDLSGVLFINFVPGFIHRPEKYLERLSDTAEALGMAAKHIVLDITRADSSFETVHLRSISDYCNSKGYAVALDDISDVSTARHLLKVGNPDYIKLDMKLVQDSERPESMRVIRELLDIARDAGCTVIAEGVESEEIFGALKRAGVALFQGYYFSPPVEAEKAARQEVS